MNENETGKTPAQAQAGIARLAGQDCMPAQPKRGNAHVRTVQEVSRGKPPACAKKSGGLFWESQFVPVSFVAKDWNVTPRRIRSLLVAERLEGRRQANGYWEVAYPYRFIIGTRGPALKRSQAPKRGRPRVGKPELRAV